MPAPSVPSVNDKIALHTRLKLFVETLRAVKRFEIQRSEQVLPVVSNLTLTQLATVANIVAVDRNAMIQLLNPIMIHIRDQVIFNGDPQINNDILRYLSGQNHEITLLINNVIEKLDDKLVRLQNEINAQNL